jgi:CRISPR-associated exonuclease Cas4
MTTTTHRPILLTPTDLLQYCYCPRFIYFERVLMIPERQEKRFKVQKGRKVHTQRALRNRDYKRRKLDVVEKKVEVPIKCEELGFRGEVDEVLFLADGTACPLDYKYAEWKGRIWISHRLQNVLYGLMIREAFDRPVTRGYLVFTRSKSHVKEVEHGDKDVQRVMEAREEILRIIRTGYYPDGTRWEARCGDCCYRNICV